MAILSQKNRKGMCAKGLLGVAGCLLFFSAQVGGEEVRAPGFQPGECVVFREGGSGYLLKTPTYWVQGRIAAVESVRRLAGRCPEFRKPMSAYSRKDWAKLYDALPCVETEADVREVNVWRVKVTVERWETPWSSQHGTVGWLFRGMFVNMPLQTGVQIEMDASWLERCDSTGEE